MLSHFCAVVSVGTDFAYNSAVVAENIQPDADLNPVYDRLGQPDEPEQVSVLTTRADWAWPMALRDIFQPVGVNLLVADGIDEFVNVLRQRRIHTAIVDTDITLRSDAPRRGTGLEQSGLWALRIIRIDYPLMPCILLTSRPSAEVLEKALQLDAFSVMSKPVDMRVLKDQLNRLFVKRYGSHIFSI